MVRFCTIPTGTVLPNIFWKIMISSPNVSNRLAALMSVIETLTHQQKARFGVPTISNDEVSMLTRINFLSDIGLLRIVIPERGEDGGYMLILPGPTQLWLTKGIDVLANTHHFHRISSTDSPVTLTYEWQADNILVRAKSTIVLLEDAVLLWDNK
jgi:hypothetical protein